MIKKTKIAIIYDFDGTLAAGNIQESGFLPSLGIKNEDFWSKTKELAEKHNMSEILAYMKLMIKEAVASNQNITEDNFKEYGKNVNFFNGVEGYFERINKYVEEKKSTSLEHYIISSGTKEMIEGTSINKHFKYVFACSYMYDTYGKPVWPAVAIDYTSKTQFLFRINKGIINCWDNSEINKNIPEKDRPIPFENMIYIGDGETDIPAMKMVNYKGGISIAVYKPNTKGKEDKLRKSLEATRVNCIAPADYSENKDIDKFIKIAIDKIVAQDKLIKMKK